MIRFGWLVVAALLASPPAWAAEWTIDPGSKLGFSGNQSGTAFAGSFAHFTGTIAFDPASPGTGHADITIDVGTAKTGDTQRDEALPHPEWFDAAKFPQARFVVSSFRSKGGDAYEAVGKLTIRDVTQDVILPFTLTLSGETAHAKGHIELIRTAYGVGQGPWASPQWVALEVGVDLDVVAKKAGG